MQRSFRSRRTAPQADDLFYVGPREKDQFIAYLNQRLRDKRLEGLVKNLFRPSYGGNRNYTLMYTLGGLMVSADDDMRPYALMEHSTESLNQDEVCRGRLHKAGENGYSRKSFDIIASFLDVLGKPAGQAPDNYERRTYCGSWTTSSASSKLQSGCGRPWSRSVTSRKIARGCRKYA